MAGKLPGDIRQAIKRYGPSVDGIAKQYGLTGKQLLAKTIKGESGGRMNAVSPAGARGAAQFMPGSRQIAVKKYGIDPWRSGEEAVHAMALHLRGKINGSKGLEGYNPGDPSYAGYILGQKVGKFKGSGGAPPTVGADPGSEIATTPSGSFSYQHTDIEGALTAALMGGPKGGSLFGRISHELDSGAYDSTKKVNIPGQKIVTPLGSDPGHKMKAGAGDDWLKIDPNANRKGHDLKPYLTNFLEELGSRMGHTIEVGTGTNHNRMTVDGNVSDHWDGSGADLPATGAKGDRIATSALIQAGVPRKKAARMARNGGLYNIVKDGVRYQIIWKTNQGGNHFNHVHIGIRPK